MMKRSDLEQILAGKRSKVTEEFKHLVPAIVALYRAGLTIKQLEAMFPPSRQWIRNRLREKGVEFRKQGPRKEEDRGVDPDLVLRILKKNRVNLKDLPAPTEPTRRKRR